MSIYQPPTLHSDALVDVKRRLQDAYQLLSSSYIDEQGPVPVTQIEDAAMLLLRAGKTLEDKIELLKKEIENDSDSI